MNIPDNLIMGVAFICVGTLVMGIMVTIALILFRRTAATQSWQPVTGQVLSSQIVWQSTSEGQSASPQVIYAYRAMGNDYRSDKVSVGGSLGGTGAGKIVARYPAGSSVQVYYNPQKPQDAVLERRSPTAVFLAIFGVFMGVVFCGGGAAALIFIR